MREFVDDAAASAASNHGVKKNANGVVSSTIEMTAGNVTAFANMLWPNTRNRAAVAGSTADMSSRTGIPSARNSGVTISRITVWTARIQNTVVS